MTNIYNALINENRQEELERKSIDEEWIAIRDSMTSAAKEVLPKQRRDRKQAWMTDEILEKMAERKKMKSRNVQRHRKMMREIDNMCKIAKQNFWDRRCEEIETLESRHHYKEMHKKIREITEDKPRMKGSNCIRDKEGKMLFEEEEIKKRWVEYTTDLYNDNRGTPPEIDTETAENDNILLVEVEKAIADLKNGKATGPDRLATEMLKALDKEGVQRVHALVNKIYNTGHIPTDMNESTFICLPKKAKATMCSEHRTLSLMSHLLKMILRVILQRNRRRIENEINEQQSGFMSGKGTREGIFNLKTICERYCEVDKKVYACFIDYEKAFDRVNHKKMIECLKDIGTKPKDVKLIVTLYWTQRAAIQLGSGTSGKFEIKRGVRQGCVLSPSLFNLFTEYIFRTLDNNKGINIGGHRISNLRYAYDTVLLAESEEELQEIVDIVNEAGKSYNMKMNARKTKTMVISKKEGTTVTIRIDGTEIEQVQSFIYLGHKITQDGRSEEEVKRRIGIARTAFSKMNNTLTKPLIPMETRLRILKCYVWSTLLYGAETWTISNVMKQRLCAFEMWCYRKMMNIKWQDRVKNEEVIQRANIKERLFRTIKKRTLIYFGHMIRKEDLQRKLLDGKINGTKSRGRPRTMWTNNISHWSGMSYIEATRRAGNRNNWRAVASNPL